MKKRSTEYETVFNQTKGNPGFRNFHLRGKAKAGTEWGLLMIGYDFKQLVRLMNAYRKNKMIKTAKKKGLSFKKF